MTRAGYRVVEGEEPEIILSIDEFNEEYAVIIRVCAEKIGGIDCFAFPINPKKILRVAEEIRELEAKDYAPTPYEVAIQHAEDIAKEKLEELKRFKRSYSCNDLAVKGGPN